VGLEIGKLDVSRSVAVSNSGRGLMFDARTRESRTNQDSPLKLGKWRVRKGVCGG